MTGEGGPDVCRKRPSKSTGVWTKNVNEKVATRGWKRGRVASLSPRGREVDGQYLGTVPFVSSSSSIEPIISRVEKDRDTRNGKRPWTYYRGFYRSRIRDRGPFFRVTLHPSFLLTSSDLDENLKILVLYTSTPTNLLIIFR